MGKRITVHTNQGGACSRCGLSLNIRGHAEWPEGSMIALRRKPETFVAYVADIAVHPDLEKLCELRDTKTQNLIVNLTERVDSFRPHTERKEDGESKTETQG